MTAKEIGNLREILMKNRDQIMSVNDMFERTVRLETANAIYEDIIKLLIYAEDKENDKK